MVRRGAGKQLALVKDGKAKKLAAVDEGNRRRSNRNIHDDKATLDKAMDRAKVKNLDAGKGNKSPTLFPTVLSTHNDILVDIANKLGVQLGSSETEVDDNLNVIKELEQARTVMFLNSTKLSNDKVQLHEDLVNSFDPETLEKMDSSSEDEHEEDFVEMFEARFNSSERKMSGYTGVASVKPKIRIRKNSKRKYIHAWSCLEC